MLPVTCRSRDTSSDECLLLNQGVPHQAVMVKVISMAGFHLIAGISHYFVDTLHLPLLCLIIKTVCGDALWSSPSYEIK